MLFRLAETLNIADPDEIEETLPAELVVRWARYFAAKERRVDKLEYYMVQLSKLLAMVVGVDQSEMVMPRDDDGATAPPREQHITGEQAALLFRAAFGC